MIHNYKTTSHSHMNIQPYHTKQAQFDRMLLMHPIYKATQRREKIVVFQVQNNNITAVKYQPPFWEIIFSLQVKPPIIFINNYPRNQRTDKIIVYHHKFFSMVLHTGKK